MATYFSNTSPAAVASATNVSWQRAADGSVSAYVTAPTVTAYDNVSTSSNVSAAVLVNSGGNAGMYKISVYLVVTSAGSVSSTLPSSSITYTDKDNATSQTIQVTSTQTGNTLTTLAQATITINASSAASITISTAGYASSAAGMTYSLHVRVEYMLS